MLAGARLFQVVVLAVAGGHGRDGLAQCPAFLVLDETGVGHGSPSAVRSSTRASTAPTSTCCPAVTLSSASTPSAGAVMVCSIFMASSQISGRPARTVSPSCAPTRITRPGMGATSDPFATAEPGSTNRGITVNPTPPAGESTNTASPYRLKSYVVSTPA